MPADFNSMIDLIVYAVLGALGVGFTLGFTIGMHMKAENTKLMTAVIWAMLALFTIGIALDFVR